MFQSPNSIHTSAAEDGDLWRTMPITYYNLAPAPELLLPSYVFLLLRPWRHAKNQNKPPISPITNDRDQ